MGWKYKEEGEEFKEGQKVGNAEKRRVWKQSRERSMGKISHKGKFLSLSRDRRSYIRALVSKKNHRRSKEWGGQKEEKGEGRVKICGW